MCKPFPPLLVRGGVFLVGLGTKYRDIADGNSYALVITIMIRIKLGTKYRDIADGNFNNNHLYSFLESVGNQVPRYSGWKHNVRGDLHF